MNNISEQTVEGGSPRENSACFPSTPAGVARFCLQEDEDDDEDEDEAELGLSQHVLSPPSGRMLMDAPHYFCIKTRPD